MSNLSLFITVTLAVTFILITTQIFGRLVAFFGQPKVVGEMISGVLLGPTCFGYFFPGASAAVFTPTVLPFLYVLGNLGLVLYMFLIGSGLDLDCFTKKQIKQSATVSISTILVPLVFGALIAGSYYGILSGGKVSYLFFSLFIGTALAITAFPMMARIMDERNLLNTKFGSFIMLSASVQDVVSWILLAFVTSMAKNEGLAHGFVTLASAFLAVVAAFFVLTPIFKKMGKITEATGSLSLNHFSIIIITVLISAVITDWLGLYSVFGGFILGLSMPRGAVFQKEIQSKLYFFVTAFGLPLFFTFSGLNANLLVLSGMTYFVPCMVILIIAFASKYLSSLFAMKSGGFSWAESSATGGLMNARGLMELIVINIGLTYGIINTEFYSILILVAIITTLGAIPIFKVSMRGKELSFNS